MGQFSIAGAGQFYIGANTEPAIVDFILRKSDGVIGEISTILRNAARNAIQYAREQIDLEMLERLNYQSPSERRAVFEKAPS